jgi:16S rRNA G1207 methylase RsmC
MLNLSLPASPDALPALHPTLHWTEGGQAHCARWRSERGAPAPKRLVLADDTTSADTAYRHACEGTALLWRGDFHNGRQLLKALARRADQVPQRKRKQAAQPIALVDAFHRHRLAQSQRARLLGMLLIEFNADYSTSLRRAPDMREACTQAWGAALATDGVSVASLRELSGITSAQEWRRVGVEIAALGAAPDNRIHAHYGVFSPVRSEYIPLVAAAHLPKAPAGQPLVAFDIGTGTGVLAAVLVRRGVDKVVATDLNVRALACARDNINRLGLQDQVQICKADLFPQGQASLIVCNPPWLPARPSSPLEHAVYDEGSRMLMGFLQGLAGHLLPKGEGWLILSNLAEHLGLRTHTELLEAFERFGLRVISRIDARAQHGKADDASDPLAHARSREVTSLWRLAAIR